MTLQREGNKKNHINSEKRHQKEKFWSQDPWNSLDDSVKKEKQESGVIIPISV